MTASKKIYRLLLRAYSRDHRARYADPMEQLFGDRLREVRGFTGFVKLWCHTFADWVVSVPPSYLPEPTCALYRSFGEPARRCVFFAHYEAHSFGSREVNVNHLLLGIVRQQRAIVPPAAREAIVRAVEQEEPLPGRRQAAASTTDLKLGDNAARMVAAANEIAHAAGRPTVTPADLASAIVQNSGGLAAGLLREYTGWR
jgi:histone H3/H4